MRRDCVHKTFNLNICVKLQKTSETSKSFENNILSRAIQTAFEINIVQFFITVVGSSSHMLGNKKVKPIMFHRRFYEIISKASNFQERAKFPSRIITIVSQKDLRITNAISGQKTSHVMDRRVCYSWSLSSQVTDKPRILWRYKINILLLVDDYTLFVCIWSKHLKLYLRKWSSIQISLKKHLLYNFNWSFFEQTVACPNITTPCCVAAVCLCKISAMGESFVSCSATFYPRLDSR